jgi:hypothetical protein
MARLFAATEWSPPWRHLVDRDTPVSSPLGVFHIPRVSDAIIEAEDKLKDGTRGTLRGHCSVRRVKRFVSLASWRNERARIISWSKLVFLCDWRPATDARGSDSASPVVR